MVRTIWRGVVFGVVIFPNRHRWRGYNEKPQHQKTKPDKPVCKWFVEYFPKKSYIDPQAWENKWVSFYRTPCSDSKLTEDTLRLTSIGLQSVENQNVTRIQQQYIKYSGNRDLSLKQALHVMWKPAWVRYRSSVAITVTASCDWLVSNQLGCPFLIPFRIKNSSPFQGPANGEEWL